MSGISIRIDPAGFEPFMRQVSRIEAAIPRAIAQGLNEGGDRVRTQVQKALWKQTGASKYKSITSRVTSFRAFAEGDRIGQSSPGHAGLNASSMTYQIVVKGGAMKLDEFPLDVRQGRGGGVDAKTWGVDHVFKRSFQTKGGKLMARLPGATRFPIRTLKGPNLAKELGEGVVPSVFTFATHAFVGDSIVKKLSRVL